ncbi:MAG TPA: PrsW family intramembrane metalloprotease [Microcella sp.]|nr:PrsW family intramembrane metalloprotease [Microcella sp.]
MSDFSRTPDYTATGVHRVVAPLGDAPSQVRAETGAHAITPSATSGAAPRRRGAGWSILIGTLGFTAVGLVSLFVVVYLVSGLGATSVVIGAVLALVPLGIVFWGVRWIDRWEPEPRTALFFAFLWGAGASVFIALAVDAEVQSIVAGAGGSSAASEFVGAAVQAPIVEELAKGLGVLLLFLGVRRRFDGPVDGIVYAAVVAGGFAFTENILYFGVAFVEGGSLGETFFVRGLMSPFAHVMFTAAIGAALGFAARRGARFPLGAFLLGLVPAIALHAFWNGALFFVGDFYGYYLLVQVPMFVIAVAIVTMLRAQEGRLIGERLAEYAAVGWFHPQEVAMLSSRSGRRTAEAWAKGVGLGPVMHAFIRDATQLAYARQRVIAGRDRIGAQLDEHALLARVADARHRLAAPGVRSA